MTDDGEEVFPPQLVEALLGRARLSEGPFVRIYRIRHREGEDDLRCKFN